MHMKASQDMYAHTKKKKKNHVSKQEHTVETIPTSKAHVYANIQMRGAQSNTHTQWGLENCHACWHRHAWRMALSTVLHAIEQWLVLKPTMIQEGWMSHWKESNAPARYLKKTNRKQIRQDRKCLGQGENTMKDRRTASMTISLN